MVEFRLGFLDGLKHLITCASFLYDALPNITIISEKKVQTVKILLLSEKIAMVQKYL